MSENVFVRFGRGLILAFVLGVLATGCRGKPATPTDTKILQEHADELKKQHEREKSNK